MVRPDFDRCTKEATKLLYKQNLSDRILNIMNLDYDKNIMFDSIQNYCRYTKTPAKNFLSTDNDTLKDGCTLFDRKTGYYIVLYNDEIKYFEHRNWTLGHEVGHIYLGHTKDDDLEEVEAHFFASQLFMPEYTLLMMSRKYGPVNVYALTEIFGVSFESAAKRISTMRKKSCFSATERDKEIWNTQEERVALYYECLKSGADFRNALLFWNNYKRDYERFERAELYANMLPY